MSNQLNIKCAIDETVHVENQSEINVSYASKGPVVNKRSRSKANAATAPYSKSHHDTDNKKGTTATKERVEVNNANIVTHETTDHKIDLNITQEEHCTIGYFVDVVSSLPELVVDNAGQSSLKTHQGEHKTPSTNGKPGIPLLPDTSPSIHDKTTTIFPRVVIHKKPNILCVPIPQVRRR